MFGVPTTTASGFSFGAPGGSAPGGGSASTGFSFGATPGVPAGAGTGTTAGMGGFGLGAAGTSTTITGAAGGFNFGAAATKATAGTAGGFSGFSFGGPQPTQAQAALAAPAAPTANTGFSFGATPGAVTGAGGGGLQLGAGSTGFDFKSSATSTTSAPAAGVGFTGFSAPATTTSTGSMLSGLLGSTTSATTPAAAGTIPTTTSASTGFSFGSSFGPTTATTTTTTAFTGFEGPPAYSTSTAASTGATAGPGTFSLKNTPVQQATSTTTAASILPTFGTTSVASTVTSSTSVSAASSFPGAAGQKQMTFRQLEDTINKWTTELEEQEKYFLDQATQVNAWDRIVMENGEKIIQLNGDVEKVKLDQQKLDHELDFVHSQQRELEALLTPLEKALDSMPPISYQQHADVERENTYMLAESLDAQLKRMGQDLKEIIERLNTSNTAPDPNDPVQQITKILNAHVVSLMWVDRNSANLQRRVEEISRQMDIEKREQERNFRLAYS